MRLRLLAGVLGFVVAGLYAGSAFGLTFSLDVLDDGASQGSMNQTMMQCSGAAPRYDCSGTGAAIGNLGIDMWNFSLDEDPVVTGTVVVTNNAAVTTHYTLIFTLGITAPTLPSSLIGGSMQGGTTDGDGNGSTLATFAGSSFYQAQIDGATVQALYAAPQSFSAGAFLSTNVPAVSFGTPIPSQPAVAALTSIGIVLDFTLTPNDSASFTSNFVVQAVPEPGTALLVGLGMAGFALVSRRRGARAR